MGPWRWGGDFGQLVVDERFVRERRLKSAWRSLRSTYIVGRRRVKEEHSLVLGARDRKDAAARVKRRDSRAADVVDQALGINDVR